MDSERYYIYGQTENYMILHTHIMKIIDDSESLETMYNSLVQHIQDKPESIYFKSLIIEFDILGDNQIKQSLYDDYTAFEYFHSNHPESAYRILKVDEVDTKTIDPYYPRIERLLMPTCHSN
jgi:hypothetical protein